MSTKEFWYEEPSLLWTYRKVYMDNLKLQNELENQQAWRIGLYVFEAVSTAIYNNFRKEGCPTHNYCEKPYDFNQKPKSEEEKKQEEIKRQEEIIKENLRRAKEILKQRG